MGAVDTPRGPAGVLSRRTIPLEAVEADRKFRPHIYWYLSFRCNLACKHCSVFSSPWVDTSGDLSTDECMRVVDQMADLRVGSANLTGGEALLRPDAKDIIRALADRGVPVALESNGLRFDDGFVTLPAAAAEVFTQAVATRLDDYADAASAALPQLRGAFLRTRPAQRFDWEHVEHAVVAGMFLDLAIGSCLWKAGLIRRRYDDTVVWAIDSAPSRNSFGVQWIGSRIRRCAVAQLWHVDVPRPALRLAEADVRWLCTAARGGDVAGDPRMLLRLRYFGFVSRSDDTLHVRIPALVPSDCEHLFSVLAECAMRLVQRVVRPLLANVERLQPGVPMARDSYRHVLIRLLLEAGIDRVVASGLCEPFPKGVPPAEWGRWLWEESACGHSLVAGAFERVRSVTTV